MKVDESPIQLSYSYSASVGQLWEALTNHDQMIKWFFSNIPEFKAKKGFETSFPVKSEHRSFLHIWTVESVQKNELMRMRWRYEEYEGDATVTFLVSGTDTMAYLTLRMDILKDFVADIPEFTRESCEAGWNYFLNEELRDHLEG